MTEPNMIRKTIKNNIRYKSNLIKPSFISGRSRANAVIFFLVGTILLEIITGLMLIANSDINIEEFNAFSISLIITYLLYLLLLILSVVFFMMWIYRVYKNLPSLGIQFTQYSPGWAVGYFFIPLVNIVIPYLVVKEIWEKSGRTLLKSTLAERMKRLKTSLLVGWWWAFQLISTVGAKFIDRIISYEKMVILFGTVTGIISTILSIIIVIKITRMQEEKKRFLETANTTSPNLT
jgi:hypothetical protein